MNPNGVNSTLLLGSDFDYTLFKTAIFFAESGMNVWFISPVPFEKIPENVIAPERQILQLITFFYLKDHKDLLSHLNSIHMWHKIPDVIILSNLDFYCNLFCDNYSSLVSALVIATLFDSASVCARKKLKAYLIITCLEPPENCKNRVQVLCDMYFPHVLCKSENNEVLFNDIVNHFLNKNLC